MQKEKLNSYLSIVTILWLRCDFRLMHCHYWSW